MGASDSDADKINCKSIFIARLPENGEQHFRKAINSNYNSSNNSNNNNMKSTVLSIRKVILQIIGNFILQIINWKCYTADTLLFTTSKRSMS